MPRKPRGGRRGGKRAAAAPLTGRAALYSMARNARDQALGAVQRRYTGKRGLSALSRDVGLLMSVVNTEDKAIDGFFSATVTQTASWVVNITPPAQGLTSSTRIGNSLKVNKLDVIWELSFGGALATEAHQNQTFNVYIVRWLKTPSTAGTTPFNIADFMDVDTAGRYTPLGLADKDTMENFDVLYAAQHDIVMTLATTAVSTMRRVVKCEIPVDFHQTFNDTTAASIVDNSLFIVAVAAQPVNTGGASGVAATVRVWFIDN
jgi:hypothetical protein